MEERSLSTFPVRAYELTRFQYLVVWDGVVY